MSWWGWIIAGAILFGAELGFVSAQFYLVFIGSAAIVVGLITAVIPALVPQWVQWAIFAILAIVSMVAFRNRIYSRLHGRGHAQSVGGPADGLITLPVSLAPGDSCQAECNGTYWTVRNDGVTPIPSGARARVASVQGLTLLVRPDV